MSLSFPTLVLPTCVGWKYGKRSLFRTTRQDSSTGRRGAKARLQMSVRYGLDITYEFLKNKGITYDDDLAYLQGFYEGCGGGYGYFLFDPSRLSFEPMSVVRDVTKLNNGFFAIGDGATTTFQLWRSSAVFGGGSVTRLEMIQHVTTLGGIYVNGVLQSPSSYAISDLPAQVTFDTAPGAGTTLAWEGNYSYLCEFAEDVLDVQEFLYQFWELQSLKLQTVNL